MLRKLNSVHGSKVAYSHYYWYDNNDYGGRNYDSNENQSLYQKNTNFNGCPGDGLLSFYFYPSTDAKGIIGKYELNGKDDEDKIYNELVQMLNFK